MNRKPTQACVEPQVARLADLTTIKAYLGSNSSGVDVVDCAVAADRHTERRFHNLRVPLFIDARQDSHGAKRARRQSPELLVRNHPGLDKERPLASAAAQSRCELRTRQLFSRRSSEKRLRDEVPPFSALPAPPTDRLHEQIALR